MGTPLGSGSTARLMVYDVGKPYSTHHHVLAFHLHRYVSEFDYRYNTRKIKDGERTMKAIQMTTGKRLMYQQPIEHE